MSKKEKVEETQPNMEGKMTIQFLETSLATSPIVGNVYEGKVSVLNTATAKRFIEHGHAKQVPHGTKSLDKVDAVESDDDEDDLEPEPKLDDRTNAELKALLDTVKVEYKTNDSKAKLVAAVEGAKEKFVEIATDLDIEIPEDTDTAGVIGLIDAETAE